MAFDLKEVVPWGRNFDEYTRMFDLTGDDLNSSILGCGDGPASFNCQCNAMGGDVVSVDPLYIFTKEEIQNRIEATSHDVLAQAEMNRDNFVWDIFRSVKHLGNIRMDAMRLFLSSYDEGKKNGRYIIGGLPYLPFRNMKFHLSLCSHFLFLYTKNLSYEFHLESIREMLRVSSEARIFPLLDMNARRSHYLDRVLEDFKEKIVEIRRVDYEFQKGGNELLIIKN